MIALDLSDLGRGGRPPSSRREAYCRNPRFRLLTHVPEHRHDNEQLGLVVSGSITMVIDGQRRELRVGEMYSIRGGIPHSGESGPDGATVIDVFSPARSDWNDTPMGLMRDGWE
jgi:mannose-6-phosphate isomerase-like protein (cupin superfamily)